jgi:hypothetical protein
MKNFLLHEQFPIAHAGMMLVGKPSIDPLRQGPDAVGMHRDQRSDWVAGSCNDPSVSIPAEAEMGLQHCAEVECGLPIIRGIVQYTSQRMIWVTNLAAIWQSLVKNERHGGDRARQVLHAGMNRSRPHSGLSRHRYSAGGFCSTKPRRKRWVARMYCSLLGTTEPAT